MVEGPLVLKLFLFDVDGTLILTGGAGLRALALAFADLYGVEKASLGDGHQLRAILGILGEGAVVEELPQPVVRQL